MASTVGLSNGFAGAACRARLCTGMWRWMTSSPEAGPDVALAAGAAGTGDEAAGAVAAVELSCAAAATHQQMPPNARTHAIDCLIIFVRKSSRQLYDFIACGLRTQPR